jgi:hypothetical protein
MSNQIVPIVPRINAAPLSTAAPTALTGMTLGEIAVNTATGRLFVQGNGAAPVDVTAGSVQASQLTTIATANGVPQLTGAGLISSAQIGVLATSQIPGLTQSAVAGGIPQLDGSGYIALAQLPPSVVGQLHYKGAWTVNTSPVIASGGVVGAGTAGLGDYYVCANTATVSPAIDGKTSFIAGDILAFNGSTWDKINGATSEVISVNSVSPVNGNVTLTAANVGAIATSQLGALNGVATLNGAGVLTSSQLPVATTAQLGAIKVGDNLSITAEGLLSAIAGTYTLPAATTSQLGGIKVGAGLAIDGSGILAIDTITGGTY